MYSPPFGEAHLLSNLPRPAVCSSAVTTVPSLAPVLPNLSAVNWVEASLLYSLTFQVMSRLHPVSVRGCPGTLKGSSDSQSALCPTRHTKRRKGPSRNS